MRRVKQSDSRLGLGLVAGMGALMVVNHLARRSREIDFRGKVVLITGASRGLGLVLARQFAAEGAKLALLARDPEELEKGGRSIDIPQSDLLLMQCDVSRREEVLECVEETIERFGRVDVLVNNAGIIQAGPMEHMNIGDYEECMGIHFYGPLYAMLSVLPHMRRQRAGRIVNISSIGGKVAVPHLAPYCASKFALTGLSDAFRAELARFNIQVTTVNPGLMRTGSHMNALFKGKHQTEFTLFSILSAWPPNSMDARRAAHQIVEACRRGSPQLTIGMPARLAIMANSVFPNLVGLAAGAMASILPGPIGEEGDQARPGWASQTPLAPSKLTRLSDQATMRNNEQHPRYQPKGI